MGIHFHRAHRGQQKDQAGHPENSAKRQRNRKWKFRDECGCVFRSLKRIGTTSTPVGPQRANVQESTAGVRGHRGTLCHG